MDMSKPRRADGSDGARTALIRRACIEVATRLNDFREDLCIVGGLVPSLLVDLNQQPKGAEPHAGTNDLDLGLSLAIFDDQKYEAIAQRLRDAGFRRDINQAGNPTSQRWHLGQGVLLDFLIQPSRPEDKGGRLRNVEGDFAAVIVPGLHLAFRDFVEVQVDGETLSGGTATRMVKVCGPGAFIALKALAFQSRGQNKDAYDLWYVLLNRPDAAACFRELAADREAQQAIVVLQRDFADQTNIGPRRIAEFLYGRSNPVLQADVAGFVRRFLAQVR